MERIKPTFNIERELRFIREMIKLTTEGDNKTDLHYWKEQRAMYVNALSLAPKFIVPYGTEFKKI